MTRCIIHVGMHKTGTSSIQQSLAGFADGRHVYYDDRPGRSNHGSALFSLVGGAVPDAKAVVSRPGLSERIDRLKADGPRVRTHLRRVVQSTGHRTLLMSAEGMMFLSAEELRRVADALLESGIDEINIAAYVRAPAGYMTSMAQQVLAGGARAGLLPERDYCHYRESFEKFDEVFGRENVRLWKFEPAVFPSGCVVRDFCGRLGIDLPPERIRRVNESLSREAVSLLLVHRVLGEDLGAADMSGAERRALARRLTGIGRTKFRLAADILIPVLAQHRDDIAWMENRLGESLAEDLTSHQPEQIRDESDLLRVNPATVQELRALLDPETPPGATGETLREVAVLVNALRQDDHPEPHAARGSQSGDLGLVRSDRDQQDTLELSARELTERMLEGSAINLRPLPGPQRVAFIRAIMRHIATTLARTSEGILNYEGLGRFQVRQVQRAGGRRTVIAFHPSTKRSG